MSAGAEPGTGRPSLATQATRGALWTIVGFGGGQILRLGGSLILSRVLPAEAFGLMALVSVLLTGLALFSDVGTGTSIVQSEHGDEPAFLDTAWTIHVFRGLALWLASLALAIPFAHFYGDERLVWLLPASGLTAVIAGFNSTSLLSAERHFEVRKLLVVDFAGQVSMLAAMLAWVFVDRSAWALVTGAVFGSLVRLALSYVLFQGRRNRFCWDREAVRSLYRFGRWIFLSSAITFFAQQSDRLIFGKMIPIAALGVYSMAVNLAGVPEMILRRLADGILFPFLSRVRVTGGVVHERFARVRRPLLVVSGWMLSGLVAGGPVVVRLLFDPRWESAGWILQILAMASWLKTLELTNGAFLMAMGESRLIAAGSLAKFIGMIALIPAGFALGGFAGAVIGYGGSDVLRYGVSAAAVRRHGLSQWESELRLTLHGAVASGLGFCVAQLCRGSPKPLAAAAVFIVVTLVWLPSLVPHIREFWRRWRPQATAVG